MQGTLRDSITGESFTVDMIWDIYLARPVENTEHSAFADGDWLYGPIETSADGLFRDDFFEVVVVDTAIGWVRNDTIRGTWNTSGSWTVSVIVACRNPDIPPIPGDPDPCNPDRRRIGTLTMVRVERTGVTTSRSLKT